MNLYELHDFVFRCESFGIAAPQAVVRGLELAAVADAHTSPPLTAELLTLSDDELREHITELSIRQHTAQSSFFSGHGMSPGVEMVKTAIASEIQAVIRPELERIVQELRPRFDEAAAPLVDAVTKYGHTYATTSDEIINRADDAESEAFRGARAAITALTPIAVFRTGMSRIFSVSPTEEEAEVAAFPVMYQPGPVNYSVCFAAGDAWSSSEGFYLEDQNRGRLDWHALASNGLRLNSPDEVRAKVAARSRLKLPTE